MAAENFLLPEDIAHWGLKAAGLRFFRDHGLYSLPVAFFDQWESQAQIIEGLKQAGLPEVGLGMSVRFSNRSNALYQSHRWSLRTFEAVAEYLEQNKEKLAEGVFIVIKALVPRFMGNLLKRQDGTFHVEMVPGTWITSGIEPTDFGEITDCSIRLSVYQQPRRVLAMLRRDRAGEVIMGQFEPRRDPPLSESLTRTLAKQLVNIARRLTALALPPLMYEFNINEDFVPHIREVKKIDEQQLQSAVKHEGPLYEIDQYDKLADWDRVTPLYLTVGVEKSNADKFQHFIKSIQGKVKQVYVKYGMLTHPAILLREAGIQPISLRTQYKEYEFTF